MRDDKMDSFTHTSYLYPASCGGPGLAACAAACCAGRPRRRLLPSQARQQGGLAHAHGAEHQALRTPAIRPSSLITSHQHISGSLSAIRTSTCVVKHMHVGSCSKFHMLTAPFAYICISFNILAPLHMLHWRSHLSSTHPRSQ